MTSAEVVRLHTSIAQEIVRQLVHGKKRHRQWLRRKLKPLIEVELDRAFSRGRLHAQRRGR